MAHKTTVTMSYTETVYYNDDGNEVARERNYDDWTYDVSGEEPLTDQEMEDYVR